MELSNGHNTLKVLKQMTEAVGKLTVPFPHSVHSITAKTSRPRRRTPRQEHSTPTSLGRSCGGVGNGDVLFMLTDRR